MKLLKLTEDTTKYLKQLVNVRELATIPEKVDVFISNPQNHAYFALDGEKVIGFVWAYTLDRLESEPMMYIHSVDVIKEYRRLGVGKMIVKQFIDLAYSLNYRNVFLITDKDNYSGNKLYKSLGGELNPNKNLYIFEKN